MKKLIFLIFIISISILFSGCCQFWFWPGPAVVVQPTPVPVIVRPGFPGH